MDSIVGDMILQKNKLMTHIVVDEIGMHIVDSCKVKKKSKLEFAKNEKKTAQWYFVSKIVLLYYEKTLF